MLLAIAIGLLAGAFAGLFGVGGGILFVPSLVLLFDLGQVDAEATSLLAILPAVAAGAWSQHRYENVRWRAALIVGLAAVAGVELGVVHGRKSLSEAALQRLFAVLLLIVAAQLAWRAQRHLYLDGDRAGRSLAGAGRRADRRDRERARGRGP